MLVSEIMTLDPVTIPVDASINAARERMDQHGIRHLPVLREDFLVGVLSDRDLLESAGRLVPRTGSDDVELGPALVRDVMKPDPLTVRPEETVARAAELLAEWRVGCLLVARRGALLGIVSALDVLEAFVESSRYGRLSGDDDPRAEWVMTRGVVTLDHNATLDDARELLAKNDFRHLPVTRSHRLVGILSDRDVRRALGRGEPGETRVGEVMTKRVSTVALETPLSRVARQLVHEKIGALPVEGRDGHVAGMLSVIDVLARCVRVLG